MMSQPRMRASFSAVSVKQLFPVLTAEIVTLDTPERSASYFTFRSARAKAAAKATRPMRIVVHPLLLLTALLIMKQLTVKASMFLWLLQKFPLTS